MWVQDPFEVHGLKSTNCLINNVCCWRVELADKILTVYFMVYFQYWLKFYNECVFLYLKIKNQKQKSSPVKSDPHFDLYSSVTISQESGVLILIPT